MARSLGLILPCLLMSACLCLSATGCGSGPNNFDKVKEGMTESEVDALLGKGETQADVSLDVPSKSITLPIGGSVVTPALNSSSRVKKWKSGSKVVSVAFQDAKVVSKATTDEKN